MSAADDQAAAAAAAAAAVAAAALAPDSIQLFRRAVAENDRGPAGWNGPTPAGDQAPDSDPVVWVPILDAATIAHRWPHPDRCPATPPRGAWTLPYGKAVEWLQVTRCRHCWPAE